LNVSGSFSGAASPSQTPYWIAVTGSTPSTYALTGSTAGLALTGFPLAHMKGQTLPDVGTYNAALEITGTGFVPQGFGYAKVHVGKTGASSISGKLPDGTSFTAAGALLADGTIAQLFVVDDRSLYNRKGGLSGYVAFEGPLSTGRLSWQKPPITGPYYPAGFSAQVQEIGYPFSKSTGNLLTTGTISFTGGMLANSGTNAGFTFSNKRYVFNPPNPLNVKLAIDPVTGAMKGSFDFPQMVSGKTVAVKYNGLLLEDGTTPVAAVGYFLSPVISGSGSSGSVEAAP